MPPRGRIRNVILGAAAAAAGVILVVVSKTNQLPVNTVLPVITGTDQAAVGTLTTDTGTWNGNPTSFTYQWQRADNSAFTANVVNLATTPSLALATADTGKFHRVTVTAVNGNGSTPVNSAVVGPTAAQGSAGTANAFVSVTGSNTGPSCKLYSPAVTFAQAIAADGGSGCADGNTAVTKVTSAGGTVEVENGTYPAQTISVQRNPGAPLVTLKATAPHAATISSSLYPAVQIGPNCCTSTSGIALDGIDVVGGINIRYGNNGKATNIQFLNGHYWTLTGGSDINSASADQLNVTSNEIGPFCCDGDAMDIVNGSNTEPANSNVTIRKNAFHDIYDACFRLPSAINSQYPGCHQLGYGDLGATFTNLGAAVTTAPAAGTVENWTINSSTTHGSGFSPSTIGNANGNKFYVTVGAETVLVNSVASAGAGTQTWNVTRGQQGTIATHPSGAQVDLFDSGYRHTDGIQAFGCFICMVDSNTFYAMNATSATTNGSVQAIFFANDPNCMIAIAPNTGGCFKDDTFQNNLIACGCGSNIFGVGSTPAVGGLTGYWHVYYNTIQGSASIDDSPAGWNTTLSSTITLPQSTIGVASLGSCNACAYPGPIQIGSQIVTCTGSNASPPQITGCTGGSGSVSSGTAVKQSKSVIAPGTQIEYIGNIINGGWHSGSPSEGAGVCSYTAWDFTTVGMTSKANLWNNSGNTCDATDKSGTATFVNPSYLTPDLRLVQNGQVALTSGASSICGPGKQISVDAFGTARPSTGCSMGAYQAPGGGGGGTTGSSLAVCNNGLSPCTPGTLPFCGPLGQGTQCVLFSGLNNGSFTEDKDMGYYIPNGLCHDGSSAQCKPAMLFIADNGCGNMAISQRNWQMEPKADSLKFMIGYLEACNNATPPNSTWRSSEIDCGAGSCPISPSKVPTDDVYIKAARDYAVNTLHADPARLYITGGSSSGKAPRAVLCDTYLTPNIGTYFRAVSVNSNSPNSTDPSTGMGVCPSANANKVFTQFIIGKASGQDATTTDLCNGSRCIMSFDHSRAYYGNNVFSSCAAPVHTTFPSSGTPVHDRYDYTCNFGTSPMFEALFITNGGHTPCAMDAVVVAGNGCGTSPSSPPNTNTFSTAKEVTDFIFGTTN